MQKPFIYAHIKTKTGKAKQAGFENKGSTIYNYPGDEEDHRFLQTTQMFICQVCERAIGTDKTTEDSFKGDD